MRCQLASFLTLAFAVLVTAAVADGPNKPAPAEPLVREEFETNDTGGVNTKLGSARGLFLEVDALKAGAQIRKAAEELRGIATTAADETSEELHLAAHELDRLAKRIEQKSVRSVQELDATFTRTFHLLARHHIEKAKQSWFDREHRPAGQRLRAATDSFENALKASGDRANDAAVETIKESRVVSGKLVEGSGYAVDEVGHAFEGLGKQITGLGERIESPEHRRSRESSPSKPKASSNK
jgi:hypothetical protein